MTILTNPGLFTAFYRSISVTDTKHAGGFKGIALVAHDSELESSIYGSKNVMYFVKNDTNPRLKYNCTMISLYSPLWNTF